MFGSSGTRACVLLDRCSTATATPPTVRDRRHEYAEVRGFPPSTFLPALPLFLTRGFAIQFCSCRGSFQQSRGIGGPRHLLPSRRLAARMLLVGAAPLGRNGTGSAPPSSSIVTDVMIFSVVSCRFPRTPFRPWTSIQVAVCHVKIDHAFFLTAEKILLSRHHVEQ